MIDLHCHLLPAIDDGPRTLEEALDLARSFVADGITIAVATPHLMPRTAHNTWPRIETTFATYKEALMESGITLDIRLAAEVRVSIEVLELISQEKAPVLGYAREKSVILLEFPHTELLPAGSEELMRWVIRQNKIPMIAHPERHKTFQRHPERLEPFLQMGCLLQVTGGSLLGKFGKEAEKLALSLLDSDQITVLASDAHDIRQRPPNLSATLDIVRMRKSESVARRLLRDTAAHFLGMPAVPSDAV